MPPKKSAEGEQLSDKQDRLEAEADIQSRPPANHEDAPDDPPAPQAGADDGSSGDDAPKPDKPPPYAEDPRLSMADRFTERRKQKKAEEEAKEPQAIVPKPSHAKAPQAEDEGEGDEHDDTPGDEGAPAPQAEAQPETPKPEGEDDPMVELVVRGKKVTMPQSEVLAIAQKNLAADDYLEQAKNVFAQASESARSRQSAEHHGDDDDEQMPGADGQEQHQLTPERRRELIETIQTGSPEEADEAYAELQEANRSASPEEIAAMVSDAIQRQEARSESTRALEQLRQEYPEIAEDEDLSLMTLRHTVAGMAKALEDAGVPAEYVDQVRGNPSALRDYYAQVRAHPNFRSTLRGPGDLARDAAKAVHEKYVAPLKARENPEEPGRAGRIEVSSERKERKAGLDRQPRSASLRSSPGGQPEQSVQDKRKAAFAEVARR